ncbi:hypothetical protein D3C73_1376190 [compost metagenome]
MPPNNMKLANTRMDVLLNISYHFFAGESVGALFALILTETAKSAMGFANISKI